MGRELVWWKSEEKCRRGQSEEAGREQYAQGRDLGGRRGRTTRRVERDRQREGQREREDEPAVGVRSSFILGGPHLNREAALDLETTFASLDLLLDARLRASSFVPFTTRPLIITSPRSHLLFTYHSHRVATAISPLRSISSTLVQRHLLPPFSSRFNHHQTLLTPLSHPTETEAQALRLRLPTYLAQTLPLPPLHPPLGSVQPASLPLRRPDARPSAPPARNGLDHHQGRVVQRVREGGRQPAGVSEVRGEVLLEGVQGGRAGGRRWKVSPAVLSPLTSSLFSTPFVVGGAGDARLNAFPLSPSVSLSSLTSFPP